MLFGSSVELRANYLQLKVLRKPKHTNRWTADPRYKQRRKHTVSFSCVIENFSGFQSQE